MRSHQADFNLVAPGGAFVKHGPYWKRLISEDAL
jgi:hypothetical protein